MEKILLFVLIGLGAQLVDGTLGMAFGVTATTLFILSGTGAATASAVVHVVEVGTTFVSGISHWRFGNVDWGRVLWLGVPGAVGAFVGATFLSNLDGDAATPVTSSILLGLGLWVLVRFAFLGGGRVTAAKKWGVRKLAPLGLVGGLLDSTGGGGWGPVTTSTLMSAGEEQPRKIIGTVSAAEFLVAVAAVLGFLPMLRDEFAAHTLPIVGLLAGGIVAAPLAAFLVGRINPRLLGIVIGGVLVSLNLRTLLSDVVPGGVLAAVIVAWVVLVAAILGWAVRHDELPWRRRRVELAEEREPARVA
ncbi:MAG TPA: sulfite exporter TauE/SafE family protein [Actinomycetales bacterium]|nr:sulfite exporter TauE/SafE family protein [Actinomycetales bacterium]